MFKRTRKSYSKIFKAKVAFEVIREYCTLAELFKVYDVHPNLIRKWKDQAIETLPDVFARGKSSEIKEFEAKEAEYLKTIGQLTIERVNQVWATDITYTRTGAGFMYFVAIVDLCTRRVLSHRLNNTLCALFYVAALKDAINTYGPP